MTPWATPNSFTSCCAPWPCAARRLLFSAQGRDIDLHISRAADLFVLTGQTIGPDEVGQIELSAACGSALGESGARTAQPDAMSDFHLEVCRPASTDSPCAWAAT